MAEATVGVRFIAEVNGEQYEIGSAIMSEANWQDELPAAFRMLAAQTAEGLAARR